MHDLLLLEAIARDDSVVVERMLSEEFGELTTCEKNVGLLAAIRLERRHFVARLIHHAEPADVDCEDEHGNTPLIIAATAGATDIARILIKKRCDVDAEAYNGRTALHQAVWYRSTPIVRQLLRAGCDADALDNKYNTPLMLSAEAGHDDIMLLLLKAGCDVTRRSHAEGYTALHLAARGGHLACVRVLLQHLAELNSRDKWAEATAIAYAVGECRLSTVRFLMESGADVMAKDRVCRSLLHMAVPTGNKELITLLLQKGVPVNDVNNREASPLMEALNLCKTKRQIPRLLLRWGAQHNIHFPETVQLKYIKLSPIQYTIYRGMIEETKLLYDVGASIDLAEHDKFNFDIKQEIKDWLEGVTRATKDLSDLCRIVIIGAIPPNQDRCLTVRKLPVPPTIQKYLCHHYTV